MKIFDNRIFKTKEIKNEMTVDEFFTAAWDKNFLNLRDNEYKIVVFDNNYLNEELEAPIFNSLELDESQCQSKIH